MRYVYHYYAIAQLRGGAVSHNDGIASTEEPISNCERLREIRAAIAEKAGVKADKLTICSLTLLHTLDV